MYSIDEAFLCLGGFEGRLEDHARQLRATVLQWTGIPVSVGIAPTKTLAKVANRTAKKDPVSGGVCILLTAEAQEAALARLEITDLWGVAGRLAARLAEVGITTPLQLRAADPRFIRERFSVVLQRTVLELQGVPCTGLEHQTPDRKTVMASRSFGRPVHTRRELEEAVATFTARAAEKMRRQGLVAASLVVMAHTNRHKPHEPQYYGQQAVHLAVASADSARLIAAALKGFASLWRPGYAYKKAGVLLLGLHAAQDVQAGLFNRPDSQARIGLMATMDALNRRYERDTLTFAAAGFSKAWKLRSDHRSPRYTTSWKELLSV